MVLLARTNTSKLVERKGSRRREQVSQSERSAPLMTVFTREDVVVECLFGRIDVGGAIVPCGAQSAVRTRPWDTAVPITAAEGVGGTPEFVPQLQEGAKHWLSLPRMGWLRTMLDRLDSYVRQGVAGALSIAVARVRLCAADGGESMRGAPSLAYVDHTLHHRSGAVVLAGVHGRSEIKLLVSSLCAAASSTPSPRPAWTLLPPAWVSALELLQDAVVRRRKGASVRVVVGGPRGAGKSTFVRLVIRRLASLSPAAPVVLLDADIGQPEVTPPGTVSLVRFASPHVPSRSSSFSPSSSSSSSSSSSLPPCSGPSSSSWHAPLADVHCVPVGAVNPADDPGLYLAACRALSVRARGGWGGAAVVVVNLPGWVRGVGLESCDAIVYAVQPTHVVKLQGATDAQTFSFEFEGLADRGGVHSCADLELAAGLPPSPPLDDVPVIVALPAISDSRTQAASLASLFACAPSAWTPSTPLLPRESGASPARPDDQDDDDVEEVEDGEENGRRQLGDRGRRRWDGEDGGVGRRERGGEEELVEDEDELAGVVGEESDRILHPTDAWALLSRHEACQAAGRSPADLRVARLVGTLAGGFGRDFEGDAHKVVIGPDSVAVGVRRATTLHRVPVQDVSIVDLSYPSAADVSASVARGDLAFAQDRAARLVLLLEAVAEPDAAEELCSVAHRPLVRALMCRTRVLGLGLLERAYDGVLEVRSALANLSTCRVIVVGRIVTPRVLLDGASLLHAPFAVPSRTVHSASIAPSPSTAKRARM